MTEHSAICSERASAERCPKHAVSQVGAHSTKRRMCALVGAQEPNPSQPAAGQGSARSSGSPSRSEFLPTPTIVLGSALPGGRVGDRFVDACRARRRELAPFGQSTAAAIRNSSPATM